MKAKILFITTILVVISILLVTQCKKEEKDIIISEKVKLPEENTNLSGVIVKGDTLYLIYSPGSAKPTFNAGDIVVGQSDEGYLKTVISTNTASDTIILITSQAALTDAVSKLTMDTTFSLSAEGQLLVPAKIDSHYIENGKDFHLKAKSSTPILTPMGELFELKIPNISITITDPNNNVAISMAIDTLILSKNVDVEFDIDIGGGNINYFRLVGISTDGVTFKGTNISLQKTLLSWEKQVKLLTVPLGKLVVWIPSMPPIPIVFIFELGVYVGANGSLTANVSTSIANTVSATSTNTVGAEYDGNTWQAISDWQLTGSGDVSFNPSANIQATLNLYGKGSLDTKIYGVAGPTIYLRLSQYDIASYPPTDLELGAKLGGGIGFKVEIFNYGFVEFNHDFLDYSLMLYHYQPSNNPPYTPSIPNGPSSGNINTLYDFSSSTTDPDGENIAIRFDWGDGNISNWSSYVPSGQTVTMNHSWSSAGTYSVKAQARDINGGTSGWSTGHQIVISGGGGLFPDSVITTILVGYRPIGIVSLPTGDYVYVARMDNDDVLVIRTLDNMVVDTIAVGVSPIGLAVVPNGQYVYVTNQGSDDVSVIRTSDNSVVATIPVGISPYYPTALPNGNYIYVPNTLSNDVSVIRTSDNTVINTVAVGNYPDAAATHPNGTYVYVANNTSNSISVIRTSDNTVVSTIPVGNGPACLTVLPNGSNLYVTHDVDDNIMVIRTSDNTIIDTIPVGNNPEGIMSLPNSSYLFMANSGSNNVMVIRTSDNMVVDIIDVGSFPASISVLPNGSRVYVTNSNSEDVSVIGY